MIKDINHLSDSSIEIAFKLPIKDQNLDNKYTIKFNNDSTIKGVLHEEIFYNCCIYGAHCPYIFK